MAPESQPNPGSCPSLPLRFDLTINELFIYLDLSLILSEPSLYLANICPSQSVTQQGSLKELSIMSTALKRPGFRKQRQLLGHWTGMLQEPETLSGKKKLKTNQTKDKITQQPEPCSDICRVAATKPISKDRDRVPENWPHPRSNRLQNKRPCGP